MGGQRSRGSSLSALRGSALERRPLTGRLESNASSPSSYSRDSAASPAESAQDGDMLSRLIDETLLEMALAAQTTTEIVEVCPYSAETNIPGVQLLEEADSYYARRPRTDAETNNISDIFAIGDSMFHKAKFYERLRQEPSRVSFCGGRIPEIKICL